VSGLSSGARPEGTGKVVVESTTRLDALFGSVVIRLAGAWMAGGIGRVASIAVPIVAVCAP
jgi:hypothetical protein